MLGEGSFLVLEDGIELEEDFGVRLVNIFVPLIVHHSRSNAFEKRHDISVGFYLSEIRLFSNLGPYRFGTLAPYHAKCLFHTSQLHWDWEVGRQLGFYAETPTEGNN